MSKSQSGFSLIELMSVVAILGIVTAVAYPAYEEQVRTTTRSDAKILISEVAQQMQRCFTSQGTYKPAKTGICSVVDKALTKDGILSKEEYYRVNLSSDEKHHTAAKYLLIVTAIANKRQEEDSPCATFTLDQTGVRKSYGSDGSDTSDVCWR